MPFQYSRLRAPAPAGRRVRRVVRRASRSPTWTATRFYDLTGSYGVNVFGYDFYKECIDARQRAGARRSGRCWAPITRSSPTTSRRLREISGLDEVSFHMSGTEAVMQAVRLARYHTGAAHLVRFCGAYHGWWGDVQPGVGNPTPARDTYTLKDMIEDTLRVLRTRKRHRLRAGQPAAGAAPQRRRARATRRWSTAAAARTSIAPPTPPGCSSCAQVCTERGIVLIFDEVFVGFRLAPGRRAGVLRRAADMVTYGKTLGGGLAGRRACAAARTLMKRFRDDRPADICFARGTFNSHPYVMAAMNEFLRRLETPEIQRAVPRPRRRPGTSAPARSTGACATRGCRCRWRTSRRSGRSATRSRRATTGCCSITCAPQGLALSWVGTGRFIFSLNYTDADFDAVADRFVAAARAMQRRRLVVGDPALTNKAIKRRILREMLAHRIPWLRWLVRRPVDSAGAAASARRRPHSDRRRVAAAVIWVPPATRARAVSGSRRAAGAAGPCGTA